MKIISIIPARMGSSRFPGKPLALINNVPMIEYVYKKVKENNLDNGFVISKFRESRTEDGNLAYLSKNEEQKIIFTLPLTEV